MSISIEQLTSPSQIDDVIAIEEASFTNPWTRQMYLAELERPGAEWKGGPLLRIAARKAGGAGPAPVTPPSLPALIVDTLPSS